MEENIKEKTKNGSKIKRKRRAANTTDEQYEIYLREMESDLTFRSGIINPTVQDDYVLLKWKSLAAKLNCVAIGPRLSAEEWKKRFGDWKYATRSKLRKIEANLRYETGEEDIKLTPLEERGLFVWGNVSLPNIKLPENESYLSYHSIGYNEPATTVAPVIEGNVSFEIINTDEDNDNETHIKTEMPDLIEGEANVTERRNEEEIPVKDVAEDIVKTHKDELIGNSSLSESIVHYTNVYREIETKKINLENKKLQFEIAKYKFENKGFYFDT